MAVALTTCPLCEAMCGLELTLDGDAVTRVRGDAEHVLSKGFVCPKGVNVAGIRDDPDRLRTPLVRDAGGMLRPASWEEAFAVVAERLPAILERGGRDAAAIYLGNPSAHNLSGQLYGNPVLSTPDSDRLERALADLELLVCVDLYVNETTRHADVVLPAQPPLERPHYEILLSHFAVHDVALYSPAVVGSDLPPEWHALLRLAAIAGGLGSDADLDALDDQVALTVATQAARDAGSSLHGRDPTELVAEVAPRTGPERLLDLQLRAGPRGLTLADLEAAPHGLDLGALEPRLPGALRTASGKVELAPAALAAEVERMRAALDDGGEDGMLLVGRRDLRSNNSWMHNVSGLVSGPERCTLLVHPTDAAALGLADGEPATVRSRAGAVEAPVELTEDIMPGVVSLPHGWGHGAEGVQLGVARAHAGVNSNVLTDGELLEPLSGTAILNGNPVQVTRDGLGARL